MFSVASRWTETGKFQVPLLCPSVPGCRDTHVARSARRALLVAERRARLWTSDFGTWHSECVCVSGPTSLCRGNSFQTKRSRWKPQTWKSSPVQKAWHAASSENKAAGPLPPGTKHIISIPCLVPVCSEKRREAPTRLAPRGARHQAGRSPRAAWTLGHRGLLWRRWHVGTE